MIRRSKVLVVDDDEDTLEVVTSTLLREDYAIEPFSSPVLALQRLQQESYDTLLVDYQMPEINGLEFIRKARIHDKDVPIILFTAHATISHAVEAIKEGAYHYLIKPLNYDELKLVLKNSIALHLLRASHKRLELELQKTYSFHSLVGRSKAMKSVFHQIEVVSRTDTPVFIQGEKGTGKETIAKTVHYNSRRKTAPFVSMDCSSVAPMFAERELFGSEAETHDGAPKVKYGKIESAEGGTLFIDEVQNLSLPLQESFYRFLNESKFTRVGGHEKIKSDVRVIAATSQGLESAVEQKTFHKELFNALKTVTLAVPPLRERREDIPLLAEHLLKLYSQKHQKEACCFSPSVYTRLLSYDFPENVTELDRLIERACIVSHSSCVEVEDIPGLLRENDGVLDEEPLSAFQMEKQKVVENFERDYFISLLNATKGKIGEAAKISGLAERNIYEKMKKYGMKKEDFKAD